MAKTNNKGFSLIELLAGVFILAIITVPLMNNFIVSMNLTSRSEELQRENLTMTNVAEMLELTGIEDLLVQGHLNGYPVTFHSDATFSTAAFTPTLNDDQYYISLRNVLFDGNREAYDIQIIADSQSNAIYQEMNNSEMISQANLEYAFVQGNTPMTDPDIIWSEEPKKEFTSVTGVPYDSIPEPIIRRHIIMDIEKGTTDASGNLIHEDRMYVKVSYYYEVEFIYKDPLVGTAPEISYVFYGFAEGNAKVEVEMIQNGHFITDERVNLYLMYNPVYQEIASPSSDIIDTDRITINNMDEVPVNVYLVKQNTGVNPSSDTYNSTITLLEDVDIDTVTVDDVVTRVYTNASLPFLSEGSNVTYRIQSETDVWSNNTINYANDQIVATHKDKRIYDASISLFTQESDLNLWGEELLDSLHISLLK